MLNEAIEYYKKGLSVLPIGSDKVPLGAWKNRMAELIMPNGNFDGAHGIGIVCGKISGNLQIIDIDCKYDLTGKLFDDYKKSIAEQSVDLLKKMVVERSPSGGFHFIYRCEKMDGNQKLAKRPTTDEEKIKEPKEKTKVLIETRGEGGYFACDPTPGYKFIYGNFDNISTITPEERDILFDCAKLFHTHYEPVIVKSKYKKIVTENTSPFDDYNERGDVLLLLEQEGWKIVLQKGTKNLLLRPGGTGRWSADFDEEKRIFYVFTTSSEFESEKGYNPVQVLTTIKFGGDYSASSLWLRENGFGEQVSSQIKQKNTNTTIDLSGGELYFASSTKDSNTYLQQVRDGSFKLGNTTGFPALDEWWRLKDNQLVVANGHDNVGKSTVFWYFGVLSAKLFGWKWIIHAAENKPGGVFRKLIEFSLCKQLRFMTNEEYSGSAKWVDEHFVVIKNLETYKYNDLLEMGKKILGKKQYNAMLIDPYNSLYRELSKNQTVHDYDYDVLAAMRLWIEKNNCGIYINCHAQTEALRRTYPRDHQKYPGMAMPPGKADTEGGGKFANRSDDFLTFHRMTQHPEEWMWTEIHVRKVKEGESGGRQTYLDSPFKIRMLPGGIGFEDVNGFNPILHPQPKQGVSDKKIIDHTQPMREQTITTNENGGTIF